ncbi:hypothetical protein GCM10027203_67560 [Nonomuraea fastidiosa]
MGTHKEAEAGGVGEGPGQYGPGGRVHLRGDVIAILALHGCFDRVGQVGGEVVVDGTYEPLPAVEVSVQRWRADTEASRYTGKGETVDPMGGDVLPSHRFGIPYELFT